MSEEYKEEILMRMRKDPKLFNTQKKILSMGLKALKLPSAPGVAEFKVRGTTTPNDTADVRLVKILTALMSQKMCRYQLAYLGLLSGSSLGLDDIATVFNEKDDVVNPGYLKIMFVASGSNLRVYMRADCDLLGWKYFTKPYLVDPVFNLVGQGLSDFCSQFADENTESTAA